MTDHYHKLIEHFQTLEHLEHALTFLQWDHMVMMPPGGNDSRSEAIAELARIHHNSLTSPKTGDLIKEAQLHEHDPIKIRSLLEMERTYTRANCLPPELVKAQSLAGSRCEHDWRRQRLENDWQGFKANFNPVVNLSREEAQARFDAASGKFSSRYDAMLDLYCTGDSSSFIDDVFATLKKELPPLLNRIVEKQRTDPPPALTGHFPIKKQKRVSKLLMEKLGFDFTKGRIDVSVHPFSTGCRGDHRITTRFRETDFLDALLATAHETGHAAYEAGLPLHWDGLPIGKARNLCLHESQSLLFEKQIFLSKPFMEHFVNSIHDNLPEANGLSGTMLWKGATRVAPSFIRVEADEVTYPLHVILRFEIESALINGTIEVDDIPELWNSKMETYLGLSTTGNYRDGCMQDMHWTDGAFGYFPSYTIGAINSAQLFAAIQSDISNWKSSLLEGDTKCIQQWLGKHIWSTGSSLESQDIIRSATGEPTNPDLFLRHLKQRYLEEAY